MHSLDGRVATTSMQKGQCITLYLYFQSTLFSLYSCNLLQHILDRTFALFLFLSTFWVALIVVPWNVMLLCITCLLFEIWCWLQLDAVYGLIGL